HRRVLLSRGALARRPRAGPRRALDAPLANRGCRRHPPPIHSRRPLSLPLRAAHRLQRRPAPGGRVPRRESRPVPVQGLLCGPPARWLAVPPPCRFLLPEGLRVRVEVSKHGWLGPYLAEHPWPLTRDAGGREVDLRVVGSAAQDHVDKLFSTRAIEGWGAIYD